MAVTRMSIDASPAEVFALLADPYTYQHWVVGCDEIRGVEGEWPATGAVFHHKVGAGPLKVSDSTKVVEVEPDRRLVLEARARPAGVVKVTFTLEPKDGATEVCIEEHPLRGPAKAVDSAGQDLLIHLRNAESLRRLDQQVRERRDLAGAYGEPHDLRRT